MGWWIEQRTAGPSGTTPAVDRGSFFGGVGVERQGDRSVCVCIVCVCVCVCVYGGGGVERQGDRETEQQRPPTPHPLLSPPRPQGAAAAPTHVSNEFLNSFKEF